MLHAVFLPLALWLAVLQFHLPQAQSPREIVATSTAVRIERRPRPRPRTRTAPALASAAASAPARRPAVRPRPFARPRELARAEPTAPPQPTATPQLTPEPKPQPRTTPRPGTLAATLASQERQFARTVKQLRGERNPLSIATIAPSPSTVQRTLFDEPGRRYRERAMAILVPVKHWTDNGMSCYYTRYTAQFSGGGSEDGVIPWPICYPIGNDRMIPLNAPHLLPIPVPPAGYQLPAGTYLTPFLRSIYNARGSA